MANAHWLVLAGLVLSACSYKQATVPVSGHPTEIAALAGEWVGSYEGGPGGRSGSILFRLEPAGDTARGDVLMLFGPMGRIMSGQGADPGTWRDPGPQGTLLTIRFVRAADGAVAGMMDPYTDPDRPCLVHTVFAGTRRGDAIQGTFRAGCERGPAVEGSWRVNRRTSGGS